MPDRAVPTLPSLDFDATVEFFKPLGFEVRLRLPEWMILATGGIELEFFPYPGLNPATSNAMCTLRLADIDAFCERAAAAGVPVARVGIPRVVMPSDVPWGRVAWLIDVDGTQFNLVREVRE